MSSTAITAQGITIARFGTNTFETIPNVVSFQGPGGQASVIGCLLGKGGCLKHQNCRK